MKKSNVIIFALLAAISAFLLWLWYFLGFNRVDDPLDLVLSIVWWVVIAAAILVIVKMEQVRRQRIRTVYVGDGSTFNSEKGLMSFMEGASMQDAIASIVENLKYDFTREDFPDQDKFQAKYFVRTKDFKTEESPEAVKDQPTESAQTSPGSSASVQRIWSGEVVVAATGEEKPFETPEELAAILTTFEAAA
ncbi:hypothetical protein [Paraeggerthella hongkongensis]|uniref:Uncharacterized protein n=1 Tax=Paraeggerthella hongkongensis TaxID=230658 RepID=A0A3N0BL19_9ACTN|nr:hypothetical protein [Paraeggerthella hongkongensis]RNL49027.1 hypothetical protein DMP08_00805 [Paraeggerthella hongkongensis]